MANHGHGMGGMMMPPPSMNGMMMPPPSMDGMSMHMTFFWGKDVEILFSGWPGHSIGMYVLSLFCVFVISVAVEWLSASHFIKPDSNRLSAGLAQTGLHALRVGLGYMVMLAVMSFNGGVLIVAIAGHAFGFFVFGSRVFKGSEKPTDLPPMKC